MVSWADVVGGSCVFASRCGIWWPQADGWRRIGWQHVDKAIWRDGSLSVVQADVVDDLLLVDRDPVQVRLMVARDLPPVVRKRVEANVVQTLLEPVPGGSARFVARRVPGEDGVRWWARLEPGTGVDAQGRAAIARRRDELAAAWAATHRAL
ncbi:MAG: hypothetical protein EPN43_02225 [Jatrophihabitans sp.]|nr:MAG: hypothetical protein EPN43_02225 [Jatrophihabitans sp.]